MHSKADGNKISKLWLRKGSAFDIVTGPAILAIPLTLIILFSLKLNFNVYIAELVYERNSGPSKSISTYIDVNGDGKNERLLLYNYPTNATVVSYSNDNAIIDAYNLEGHWFRRPIFCFGDRDNDSIIEIYTLTVNNGDSVIVGATELISRVEENQFCYVDKLGSFNDTINPHIEIIDFSDITGDGNDDLIFSIAAGFSLQPRRVYAWDLNLNRVLKSPMAGIAYKYNHTLPSLDLDNDNVKEIFLTNLSPDNKEDIAYIDTATYLTVLTKNLDYFFLPVKVGNRYSQLTPFPYISGKDTLIAALLWEQGSTDERCKIVFYHMDGSFSHSRAYPSNDGRTQILFSNSQRVIHSNGFSESSIALLNDKLDYSKEIKLPGSFEYLFNRNVDSDSASEYILLDNYSSTIAIVEDDISSYTTIRITNNPGHIEDLSLVGIESAVSRIHIDTNIGTSEITYKKNPLKNFRIPISLFVYLMSYFIFFFLQKLFIYRSYRRKEMENKMLQLQLQSVMNQLNPHFTFNAINTIGDSILKGKQEEAYEYFTKLSELIRSSMINAFQLDKTLLEEIEFVRQYLEIEAYRFKDKLTYSIDIETENDLKISVPKMLLHIFIENAVKHGIFHRETPGKIQLKILDSDGDIIVEIADNGIGMKASRQISNSPGKGLVILENYLNLFGKSKGRYINYVITESDPGFKYPGTKVTITIPL